MMNKGHLLFFGIVAAYCLYYAPYGLNETDGGFLTGLAWQVLNGKVLYLDVVYVRPPLPVWLRAAELQLLPEHYAILGERWIFYLKLALYSWLGAALLAPGNRQWTLATLGFVVSAHCYPAMAWHTVDGILFGVLAVYFYAKNSATGHFLSGISLFLALLCKQSFYPLLPLFALFLCWPKRTHWKEFAWFLGAFSLCAGLFFTYLSQAGILSNFISMTSGAAASGQALQHGILDYFRITPELAVPSLLLLAPVGWWFWKGTHGPIARISWSVWLAALIASYAAITWLRQDHTVPFAQSRALFWVGAIFIVHGLLHSKASAGLYRSAGLLLGVSWCASVSWGYNLPILFATPWVWAGMEISSKLPAPPSFFQKIKPVWLEWALLLGLLFSFRVGQAFVYRDGRRSEMSEPMGLVFPSLSGIYSDTATAALYHDLKQLSERYGPHFKTLPAFPQANFLTQTPAPLPLDWVANRETNGNNTMVINNLKAIKPTLFIQKSFQEKIMSDPELSVTRQVLQQGTVLEETAHFLVVRLNDR